MNLTADQHLWIDQWKKDNPKQYKRESRFLVSWADLTCCSHYDIEGLIKEVVESLEEMFATHVTPFIDPTKSFSMEDDVDENWNGVERGIFVTADWIETDEEHANRGKRAWRDMYQNNAEYRQAFHLKQDEVTREKEILALEKRLEQLKSQRNPRG